MKAEPAGARGVVRGVAPQRGRGDLRPVGGRERAVLASGWVLGVMGTVVAIDQATKAIAVASLARGESVNVFLGIDLTHVRNRGIAFGALPGGGLALTAGIVVAVALLLVYFAFRVDAPLLWLPVGLVLGGAVGNLADRSREGAVIDFIDPIAWPAFNFADVSIVVGVIGLLYVAEGGPSTDAGA